MTESCVLCTVELKMLNWDLAKPIHRFVTTGSGFGFVSKRSCRIDVCAPMGGHSPTFHYIWLTFEHLESSALALSPETDVKASLSQSEVGQCHIRQRDLPEWSDLLLQRHALLYSQLLANELHVLVWQLSDLPDSFLW